MGDRTQARVGSSNSGGNGNGSSRFTFNEHNGDMSYGPFFDNEKLRISTAVGPDLRLLRPGEEEGCTIVMSCRHRYECKCYFTLTLRMSSSSISP